MRVAALQLNALGLSPNRLEYYFRHAKADKVELLLLGEYVLNPFFGELTSIPIGMIAQQSDNQIKLLKELCNKYGVVAVAPIVRVVRKEPIKSVALVRNDRVSYYDQQILINYKHWNEERFFANEIKELESPMTFRHGEMKIGIVPGFEIHFDYFWMQMMKKDVDLVLVPSVSTFGSGERWRELLSMRAFTNSLYLLRANRIGEYKDNLGLVWKFYGESLLAGPDGKIEQILGDGEEMLIAEIDKERLKNTRKEWGFRAQLRKRGMI